MRYVWVLIAAVLSLSCVAAYYADVTLDVQTDGSVAISGISDHPLLQPGATNELTYKAKSYWLFNLTIPNKLSEFVIAIKLPQGATLNYVNNANLSLSSEANRVVIKRVGSNSSISIIAQYQLPEQQQQQNWVVTAAAIIATLLLFWAVMFFAGRAGKHRHQTKHLSYIDGLPARQREIVQLLQKAGGRLTQKQIEQHMSIPKSSVSRNIDSLSRKGIVKKESLGLSNTVSLIKHE